ncbi:MAG: hypothetical protein PHH64_06640 [Proteiniphilum sp.]|nr:hypothetical protein [Proteiniphilum sp.]
MKPVQQSIILLSACSALFLFSSCHQPKDQGGKGAALPATEDLSVDKILADAESLKGETVTLEGVCTHLCQHGGKKLFLMGSDDTQTIRIEATDETGAFSPDCVNSRVTVTGKLVEERIDEAYLIRWEAELADNTAEHHGEEGEAGCASEQQAQNEAAVNTVKERIANFRTRIAREQEKTGRDYLSFYYVEAASYRIQQ